MNKCVLTTLVLLVATWQLTECKPAVGLVEYFGKATEKVGQKTVQIGQRVQEDAKVVKEKIATFITGQNDSKEHKEGTKNGFDIPVVPPTQPEIFPKLSPGEATSATTKKPSTTEKQDDRHTIEGTLRCLPDQVVIAGGCHDQA